MANILHSKKASELTDEELVEAVVTTTMSDIQNDPMFLAIGFTGLRERGLLERYEEEKKNRPECNWFNNSQ